jgi:hypothetical protein
MTLSQGFNPHTPLGMSAVSDFKVLYYSFLLCDLKR